MRLCQLRAAVVSLGLEARERGSHVRVRHPRESPSSRSPSSLSSVATSTTIEPAGEHGGEEPCENEGVLARLLLARLLVARLPQRSGEGAKTPKS